MKEYFRKPYMTQGITKHSDYMKAIPQRAIDVQGQIAPNIEFKKPYDYHPNTPQMIHYYANNLHYMGGDPVPPLNDPSLLPHAPVIGGDVTIGIDKSYLPKATSDSGYILTYGSGSFQNNNCVFGKGLTGKYECYVRFPDIDVLPKSIIKKAYVRVRTRTLNNADPVHINMHLHDNINAPAPTSYALFLTMALSSPIAYLNVYNWAENEIFTFPKITSLVQEMVNRDGWKSGSSIMFIIKDNGTPDGRLDRAFYAFGDQYPPHLYIEM